ncbi:ABC transporter ATP-binding protein [Shewanella sedimentimangrovi]|uniref:ABC transporter ATP-binding protein n=1 Tax=Shewanella sedimentimangrovi TaxID=2814293 RepID=A0ABX7R6L5_9GAMM|nr:ABC transporter ATP-binding protein [Shewanella sedimentimangrovi]QSX38715.1 ABC transporter ATP-binding protein [Shewanella sedimentimangrovi]
MSLLTTQSLSKYYGSKAALEGVDLALEAGAPIALVGPNGAGKTTLLSLLCGFIKPSKGKITILGQAAGDPALLGRVSCLPQDGLLDPNFTVLQQLSFFGRLQGLGHRQAQDEAMRVLTLVDLQTVAQSKPTTLSHGMGKRVAIAQALMGSPELVLLDEPTAGLDPANARAIRELVRAQSANTNFIISSHNLDELEKLCGTVLYLEQGRLTQSLSLEQQGGASFLSLSMQSCETDMLQQGLESLPSVIRVRAKNGKDFLIEYQGGEPYVLEQQLLELCKAQGAKYKLLQNGRSLEDTLFS